MNHKLSRTTMSRAIIIGMVFVPVHSYLIVKLEGYNTGMQIRAFCPAVGAFGREPWHRMQTWVQKRSSANVPGTTFMMGGFAFTIFLAIMRVKFLWWRFHPAGYAVSNSYNMEVFWSPLFFGWLAKTIVLRFGGLRLYRKALPFFLGLILGHFITSGTWTIIGVIINQPI